MIALIALLKDSQILQICVCVCVCVCVYEIRFGENEMLVMQKSYCGGDWVFSWAASVSL